MQRWPARWRPQGLLESLDRLGVLYELGVPLRRLVIGTGEVCSEDVRPKEPWPRLSQLYSLSIEQFTLRPSTHSLSTMSVDLDRQNASDFSDGTKRGLSTLICIP